MNSLFETRILLSRFLLIYRVYRQYRIPRSLHSQMIDEVIGSGLINPRNTRYVNAFVQLLFHILPLRLMIIAWPSRDPIISVLPLMFGAMFQNRTIDAASLSTVCERDVLDGKDCFELALHILGALRDVSSGTLRDTIEQLFCFRQITRLSTDFSSRCVSDRPLFFLHLPVSGPSTLMECRILTSGLFTWCCPPQTQQIFIRSFPRFFFLSLGFYIWGNDHMAKDCCRVAFPVMLDMTPYAVQTENRYPYQLVAVISHLGSPDKDQGHYMTFLRIFCQWIRFSDTDIDAIEESATLHENFP
jgi:hypothetical protein